MDSEYVFYHLIRSECTLGVAQNSKNIIAWELLGLTDNKTAKNQPISLKISPADAPFWNGQALFRVKKYILLTFFMIFGVLTLKIQVTSREEKWVGWGNKLGRREE